MSKRWSKAREQKYKFCPRAFYWHYHVGENHPLHALIQLSKFQDSEHLEFFSVQRALLRTLFYDREINFPTMRNILARESVKHQLSNEQKWLTKIRVDTFLKSAFFIKSNPHIVHLLEIEKITSVMCADIEILGNIDFAWTQSSGTVNMVRFVNCPDKESDLSFLLYYALKKLHVEVHHLNLGLLFWSDNKWHCQWREINWLALEDMQNAVLSFNYSHYQNAFPPTSELSHCELCVFRHFCPSSP